MKLTQYEINKMEFPLIEYFSEFQNEGINIDIYNKPKEVGESEAFTTKIDKYGNYKFIGVAEINNDASEFFEVFEPFFQRKFNEYILASISTIEAEINRFKEKYKALIKTGKYKILDYWIDFLTSKLENNTKPQAKKSGNKKPTKELEFKEFFNKEYDLKKINTIQNKFKNDIGKKIAILIYILEAKLKVTSIILKDLKKSRAKFVKSLKRNNDFNMTAINKYFDTDTNHLSLKVNSHDKDYENIIEFLESLEK